jgi:hypothetical protein
MFLITHDPSPFCLLALEKQFAVASRHVLMPRRITTSSFRGHGRIPFCKGSYPRPALGVCGSGVDHLDVSLEGLVENIVAVGLVPPSTHSLSVRPQVSQTRVCECRKPDVGQGRDIV